MRDSIDDPNVVLRDWYKDTKRGEDARRLLMEADHPKMFKDK